jgi:branched-subunit amino acid transport protein
MSDYFYAILGMSLATQIPRLIPALVKTEVLKEGFLKRFLDSIPLAALGALIVPGIFSVGGTFWIGLVGGLFSLFLASKKINLMLNITLTTLLVSLFIYFRG